MDKHIGAQFYTIRDYIQTIEDFDKSCKKLSDIGYKLIQVSGTPLKANEMREVLDKYGMYACSSHRSFTDFQNNLDEVIEYNKILGCEVCGLGSAPLEYMRSNEALTGFINEANKISEIIKKEGMSFGYHNHATEFLKLDGKYIFDRLVEEMDPDAGFILDTYWCQVGGQNPVKIINDLGKRAVIMHYKDYAVNPDNVLTCEITEVGNGNLYWDEIIEATEKAGSKWVVVEQDTSRMNPFDSLKISYDFLTKKGFI
ncbi:MAG: sugar phosphate isomerase/epimerase [Clostridia bacterium]|nr:sugar phosphate isomerase/epimerase [Clostridia bacterium]